MAALAKSVPINLFDSFSSNNWWYWPFKQRLNSILCFWWLSNFDPTLRSISIIYAFFKRKYFCIKKCHSEHSYLDIQGQRSKHLAIYLLIQMFSIVWISKLYLKVWISDNHQIWASALHQDLRIFVHRVLRKCWWCYCIITTWLWNISIFPVIVINFGSKYRV